MKSITVEDYVKDEYDLVKVKLSWSLKMNLTDSECIHLLCESDIDQEMKQIVHDKAQKRKLKEKKVKK